MDVYIMRRVYSLDVGWHLTVKLCKMFMGLWFRFFFFFNRKFRFSVSSWVNLGILWFYLFLGNGRFLFLENILSEDYFYGVFNSYCEHFYKQYFIMLSLTSTFHQRFVPLFIWRTKFWFWSSVVSLFSWSINFNY